jgi:signal transduction histidine kinase
MTMDLKSVRLFTELSEAQLKSLHASSESRFFEKEQTIFKEGDPGDGIYLIAEGAVCISVRMPNLQLCQLARLEKGDFFGEMAVLDQGPRSASVSAIVKTEVIFIPRQIILDLFHESSSFALRLFNETSARLREFNQKYVEESLQAERLSLVGRFARSIVHDFKNPLNVIRLASEFSIQSSVDQSARKKTHDRIAQQVDHLSGMINELLEFTRGDRAEVVLSPSNYGQFLSNIIAEIGAETSTRGVQLELDSDMPDVELSFDPRRLKHVFHNLVANAADAMSGGGVVYFRIRQVGQCLETDIEDTGPGIHPEIVSRLFEAFATYGKKQGTGLGLSICQKIIHDHRGKIEALPNEGKGALFRISLPI